MSRHAQLAQVDSALCPLRLASGPGVTSPLSRLPRSGATPRVREGLGCEGLKCEGASPLNPRAAPSNARCSAQRQSGFDGGGGGICCRACLTDLAMRVMYAGASWVWGWKVHSASSCARSNQGRSREIKVDPGRSIQVNPGPSTAIQVNPGRLHLLEESSKVVHQAQSREIQGDRTWLSCASRTTAVSCSLSRMC